jgi:hypothetical protein
MVILCVHLRDARRDGVTFKEGGEVAVGDSWRHHILHMAWAEELRGIFGLHR